MEIKQNKKAMELSLNVIVIFIILLIVLVVVILFFTGGFSENTNTLNNITGDALNNAKNYGLK